MNFVVTLLNIFVLVIFIISCVNGLDFASFDKTAHAYCASHSNGHVFVLRRDCEKTTKDCKAMCTAAKDAIVGTIYHKKDTVACFDAYKVYTHEYNSTDVMQTTGLVGFHTYGFGPRGCTGSPDHCGPNYCCCVAY
ncbi:uncharacterized protein [Mytilus edulis]|uniref:uncharacterized protein n=1 Tax=Mytilus edulis TaxID=6550 RepID=UPI0039EF2844